MFAQDILPRSVGAFKVSSPQMCEEICTATLDCNAASYYLDGTDFPEGKNCWLKTMADACALPGDAIDDDNAVLLLQMNESCTQPPNRNTSL
ncbi:MAG: hypothetical protein HC767_08680 [Akkermansiaceae bacterium]|nr:hypothetical protein [Akkermansiaceae bacterium]